MGYPYVGIGYLVKGTPWSKNIVQKLARHQKTWNLAAAKASIWIPSMLVIGIVEGSCLRKLPKLKNVAVRNRLTDVVREGDIRMLG